MKTSQIIPALDLIDGQVVRLIKVIMGRKPFIPITR